MFGAWQAGAWRTCADVFQPDLVVGASIGSLNGYALASGWSAAELCGWWLQSPRPPITHSFKDLPEITRALVAARPLQLPFAAVLVNALRMRPRTFFDAEVTARHLLASCAVPGVVAPQYIDGAWYVDGGLLNPLPVWAAVEWGATRILALNALPEIPSVLLRPFVKGFRAILGHHPPVPARVELIHLVPSRPLGSLTDAIRWDPGHARRWIEQGAADAAAVTVALKKTFPV
jgi:predicted acylesterase/phospholipase RssA